MTSNKLESRLYIIIARKMLAKNNLGLLAAISAPFFIALSITLVKLASVSASPIAISGIASVISLPFLLIPYVIKSTKIDFSILIRDLRNPFLQVLFTRAIVGQILIVTGFTITTAVKSILLLRLEPAFVLFWSALFRLESPKPLKVIATLFLIVGAVIVVGPKEALLKPCPFGALRKQVIFGIFFKRERRC